MLFTSVTVRRFTSELLFVVLLVCPSYLPRSCALIPRNVAPRTTRPRRAPSRGSPMTVFHAPSSSRSEAPGSAAEAFATATPSQDDSEPTPSQSDAGARVPPSHTTAQRRGNVFSIRRPQDLLDFVIEDERLSVVKVYASWCKSCQVFDVRYRKLADKYAPTTDTDIAQRGRVRFAEMQYDDPSNKEMCQLLNATKVRRQRHV